MILQWDLMIKSIIFDLGRVLIDFNYERSIQAVLTLAPDAWPRIQAVMTDQALLAQYETGGLTSVEFHEAISRRVGFHCTLEEFKRIWGAMFLPEPLISEDLIVALAREYPLLVLSNTSELHFDYVMERYPLLRHFSAFILSFQEGVMKPEKRIYEAAILSAGVAPEEIFFTDDREENVAAALQLGIQSAVFQSEAGLRQQLKDLAVLR
jgi:glucose-1-phosphatase